MFRLKSLYVKDYKNIHEQTFDFSDNTGYIALIGLNGSGKSNLLEAISIIFRGLVDKKSIPFEYEIKYKVKHNSESHIYERKKQLAKKDGIRVKGEVMIYPKSVIACYSGETSRLWDVAYKDYYMGYFKGAVRNMSFSPRFMYINKYCWKIAFLSLVCSSKASVRSFLKETLHIDDITTISIQFASDAGKRATFLNHKACKWFDTINQLQNEDSQRNINANVLSSIDMTTYGAPNMQAPDYVFQFLFLLTLPKKNVGNGQTIDKLITDIKISINGIDFDDLSEGEKKMILIECITQVLGNEDSLVLLDEPDAHVHIENKKKILETITQYNGQTIFTTHSPVMCNLIAEAKNIKLLKGGKCVDTSKLEQLKKLSGNEFQYFDGAFVLSHKKILVTEGIYDIRYIRKAIDIFSQKDIKYEKLKDIGMLYAGSASEADVIYNELLLNNIDNIDKVAFLFDYDNGGLDGWKKINSIALTEPKVVPIFYQHNYEVTLDTNTKNIDQQDTILSEDMFGEGAYASLFSNPVVMSPTHKYFRCRKKILDNIKTYLQEHYNTIDEIYYNNYEHLLEKLLSIYFG